MNNIAHDHIVKLKNIIAADPIIVCIGTDLVGGDCLGPLTGEMLVGAGVPTYVYGTLAAPITALNLEETLHVIRRHHPDKPILAIDSCVGRQPDIGKINVLTHGIRPGAAGGKMLPTVGDAAITAITAHSASASVFAAVRLGFVYAIARTLKDAIMNCYTQTIII